jgi:hypothetical protein
MRSEKLAITENLIRKIKELAELSDELTVSVYEIRAELAQLQEQLGIIQPLHERPRVVPTSKPN